MGGLRKASTAPLGVYVLYKRPVTVVHTEHKKSGKYGPQTSIIVPQPCELTGLSELLLCALCLLCAVCKLFFSFLPNPNMKLFLFHMNGAVVYWWRTSGPHEKERESERTYLQREAINENFSSI